MTLRLRGLPRSPLPKGRAGGLDVLNSGFVLAFKSYGYQMLPVIHLCSGAMAVIENFCLEPQQTLNVSHVA